MSRDIALFFLGPRHSRCGWGVGPTPRPPLPPEKTRYSLYRKLSGSQGRSGRAEILVLTGIRYRTVQPVAPSLYRLSYPAHPICLITHNSSCLVCYMFAILTPDLCKCYHIFNCEHRTKELLGQVHTDMPRQNICCNPERTNSL